MDHSWCARSDGLTGPIGTLGMRRHHGFREVVTHTMPIKQTTDEIYRRGVVGGTITLGGLVALTLVLLPFRSHLSIATPALVFVVPVMIGVVTGGFVPGAVGAVAGF